MNVIKSKYITMGFLCLVAACVCLMAGFFKWIFFLPGALLVACYFVLDRKYLRCPHCGAFTNMDRLLYARKHIYHCHGCGERIQVMRHSGL